MSRYSLLPEAMWAAQSKHFEGVGEGEGKGPMGLGGGQGK